MWYHLYVDSKKITQMDLYIKQKQSHRHKKKNIYIYMVTKGERDWGGQIMSMELIATNYYI